MRTEFSELLSGSAPRAVRLPQHLLDRFDRDGVIHLPQVFAAEEIEQIRSELTIPALDSAMTEHLGDGFESWRGSLLFRAP